jgi:hypothetical protein
MPNKKIFFSRDTNLEALAVEADIPVGQVVHKVH